MVSNKDALKDDEDAPLSMTPNISILDAFEDAFEDAFDEDDGFTTIKDLAERGITKMEPLDYDDFYLVNLFVFDNTHFFFCVNFTKKGEKDKKAHEEIWQPPIYALRLNVNVFALSNSTIKTNKRIQTAIKTSNIHHRPSFGPEF